MQMRSFGPFAQHHRTLLLLRSTTAQHHRICRHAGWVQDKLAVARCVYFLLMLPAVALAPKLMRDCV